MEVNNTNNNNTNNNSKNNGKYKNNTCIMIILFLLALGAFSGIYFLHTKNIESRFNKALENYSLNIQTIISNTTIDKTVITNESENTITINNEFIISEEIANNFKSTFDINTRMLESSMSEIMKNSNDVLSFWFAFLSVIMIVFTFAGIFNNNNILSESKENFKYINDLKKDIDNYKEKIHNYELSIENLQLKIETETQRKIFELETNSNKFLKEINEKNSEALNSIDKLKIEFNNSINLIQEKSNQMISDIKKQAQKESEQLIKSIKDKAEEETKKLIEENNRNIKISNLFNSAYQAYNNKEYETSINYYNQIIEMTDNLLNGYDENSEEYSKYKNNISKAYYNRGVAKNDLKQYEEAIKDYDKAIELNPNYSEAYNNRGKDKYNLGLYKEAIEDFNKAIELNPNNSNSYNFRGNAKYNLKLYKEAIKDYDKAIELNPHYSNTYSNIGLNKINLVLYEEDIELNTNYSKYYFNKALSKQLLANNTENKEEYNKLIEEAYNDFIKSYNLFGDKLKDEYKQKIIYLAKYNNEADIKICDEKGWKY